MLTGRIGFVGAGQMARALCQGWVAARLLESAQVSAFDVAPQGLREFSQRVPGCRAARGNHELAKECETLVLAVKPGAVELALEQLQPGLTPDHLLISIAAGIPLAALESRARPARLVRVMPNTPCLVGQGASVYCVGQSATPVDGDCVHELFAAVGYCCEAPEAWLDAVTALSGSGPGYFLLIIEALIDGAVAAGLPRDKALELAGHTMLGTAKWLLSEWTHPAILRDQVSSPGGTTLAGLRTLELAGVRGALIDAVLAATRRAGELRNGEHGTGGK